MMFGSIYFDFFGLVPDHAAESVKVNVSGSALSLCHVQVESEQLEDFQSQTQLAGRLSPFEFRQETYPDVRHCGSILERHSAGLAALANLLPQVAGRFDLFLFLLNHIVGSLMPPRFIALTKRENVTC